MNVDLKTTGKSTRFFLPYNVSTQTTRRPCLSERHQAMSLVLKWGIPKPDNRAYLVLCLNGFGSGSDTVQDSLCVSKTADLPKARFWIRVDYPGPCLNMVLDETLPPWKKSA
ncbi:hypothetical protein Bbelb_122750 [Branchiostoma belcheri]|nr:hypothetical protein Bbelb_122750 [Branchiostoma belcheri]